MTGKERLKKYWDEENQEACFRECTECVEIDLDAFGEY